jgi:ankyrin repeat protein
MKNSTHVEFGIGLLLAASLCWPLQTKTQQPAPVDFPPEQMWSHRIGVLRMIRVDHPAGHEIYVTLRVIVTPFGKIESAKAIDGPKEFYVEAEKIETEREFKPFLKNGIPVRASIQDYVSILPPVQWAIDKVPFPEIKDWNSLRITLQRTGCLGMCPEYSVEIRGDGSVTFTGGSFALITGAHHEQIPTNVVVDLVNQFRVADYFSLKNKYNWDVTDNPTYTTSIQFDGNKKEVIDYVGLEAGMPEVVESLENSIDDAVGIQKWLKETAQTWPSLLAENWNFKAQSDENGALFANVVSQGSNDLIQKFLAAGVPTLWFDKNGQGPLVNAAAKGDANMVSRMLMRQEPLSALLLFRALRAAAQSGSLKTVELLLRKGANVNRGTGDSNDSETVLTAAARSGNTEVLERILKYYTDDAMTKVAAADALEAFLSRGSRNSQTGQIIKILVAAGANVNARNQRGQTPLFGACFNARAVKPLKAAGADLNAQDNQGYTALMTCFISDFTRAMIAAGADLSIRNNQGLTAAQQLRKQGITETPDILDAAMKAKHQ